MANEISVFTQNQHLKVSCYTKSKVKLINLLTAWFDRACSSER